MALASQIGIHKTALRVAHNPKVAGSNPAPAIGKALQTEGFSSGTTAGKPETGCNFEKKGTRRDRRMLSARTRPPDPPGWEAGRSHLAWCSSAASPDQLLRSPRTLGTRSLGRSESSPVANRDAGRPYGATGVSGATGATGSAGATGPAGSAAIANFASFEGVQSGQCLSFSESDESGHGSCPAKTSGPSSSTLLSGPMPMGGAVVSNLYAETNAVLTGKDTATVAVIDNATGATLLSHGDHAKQLLEHRLIASRGSWSQDRGQDHGQRHKLQQQGLAGEPPLLGRPSSLRGSHVSVTR